MNQNEAEAIAWSTVVERALEVLVKSYDPDVVSNLSESTPEDQREKMRMVRVLAMTLLSRS